MKGRGGEGGGRGPFPFAPGYFLDPVRFLAKRLDKSGGSRLVRNIELPELLPLRFDEARLETLLRLILQRCVDRPVFLLFERLDLLFPFADQSQRHRLNSPGREPVPDLLPQKRRKVETDEIVEDGSGLLSVHQFPGNVPGVPDRFRYGILGDFMEHHTPYGYCRFFTVEPESRQQVPRYRLPLTVGVSRQQKGVGILQFLLDGIDVLLALGKNGIFRFEIVLDIHRSLFAGQGADMAVGSQNPVLSAEKLLYGLRFGGRFDDDKIVRHTPPRW